MCAPGLPFEAVTRDFDRESVEDRHRDGVLVPDRTGGVIQANQAASDEKDTE